MHALQPVPTIPLTSLESAFGDLLPYVRPGIANIHCNADGKVFIEEKGRAKYLAPKVTTGERHRSKLVELIANLTDSGPITPNNASMRFDLEMNGVKMRGHAFCNPIGPGWPFTLRVHMAEIIDDERGKRYIHTPPSAAERVTFRTFDALMEYAIDRRWNITIAGPPNAGKSTHLNFWLKKLAESRKDARIIVMQQNDELQIPQEDHVKLFYDVRQRRYSDNGPVDYTYDSARLVADVLRMSADGYVFGEARAADEVRGLISAASAGAGGIITTLHAKNAYHALRRLELLIGMDSGAKFDMSARELVSDFANLVIFMGLNEKTRERWIAEALIVYGIEGTAYDAAYAIAAQETPR